jgi:hypothetical protein
VDRNADMRQSQMVLEEDEEKGDEDGEDNEDDNEDIYDTVIGWTMCAVGLHG